MTPEQKMSQIYLILLGVTDEVTTYEDALKSIKKIVNE
jgi:hypothetical protein